VFHRLADTGLHLQWNALAVKEVEGPAPVLVAAFNHSFDGFTDAAVRFDSCIPQIIESAQDVVVPKGRKRETEPASSMTSPVRSERNMRRSSR